MNKEIPFLFQLIAEEKFPRTISEKLRDKPDVGDGLCITFS
jgi:hypothetical protein